MPLYNDGYRILEVADEEFMSSRRERNEAFVDQLCSTIMDCEKDINSVSQKLNDKDSKRELDETRSGSDHDIMRLGAGSFAEYSPERAGTGGQESVSEHGSD
jgi:hypothetical protein